jgi:Right handed beta helix region
MSGPVVVALGLVAALARAATIPVAPGGSIQTAIDAAASGDTISLAAGTYEGDLDFRGKAVVVRGAGPATVLRGSGATSVVRFASGEGPGSILDSVTVTNGTADLGGGIYVRDASPTIVRTTITGNAARMSGSAAYLERSAARLYNDVVVFNTSIAGADTHAIHLVDASPTIVNDTITHDDANGIFVSGLESFPTIVGNILAYNGGHPKGMPARGRGICDLGPGTVIQWNLFFKNRKAALLTSGNIDYRLARRAERAFDEPRLANNLDASPRFVSVKKLDFGLKAKSRARNAGNPDPAFANLDGSRNTIGHLGGPYATPSTAVP